MNTLTTYFRTLRHLKPKQLAYQLLWRVRPLVVRWQRPRTSVVSFKRGLSEVTGLRFPLPSGARACLEINTRTFQFLNLEKSFGVSIAWEQNELGKLWIYNLHYFEWIWGLDPAIAKSFTKEWINQHPYSRNAVGWEPYPLSLRIQNWLAYWSTAGHGELERDVDFQAQLLASLACQCDWLSRRLEKHLLGNHLFENAASLWLAATLLSGDAAARWLRIGQNLLEDELNEQQLKDGMHFERSPMYHCRFVFVLEWLNLIAKKSSNSFFTTHLTKAKQAAGKLLHPDGRIALLNDSAFDIYPTPAEAKVPEGAFALEQAGYYGSRSGDTYLVCDAGKIGPDYIPGHAHCDIGSFEMSVGGQRLITDTGVYTYENNPTRHYSRSTAAHNTFQPKDFEQAEIWGAFRVGRRPDVKVLEWSPKPDGGFTLELTHNGFSDATDPEVSYRRKFTYLPGQSLIIEDFYTGVQNLRWCGRLHFAPGWEVAAEASEETTWLVKNGDLALRITCNGIESACLKKTDYYPGFNTKISRDCLEYEANNEANSVTLEIHFDPPLASTT